MELNQFLPLVITGSITLVFFHSGYFLALLLQCISTGVSQNVPMKDDMKNYLVPSRISIGFYLEERQWGGVGGRQKGWRGNRIAHA